MLRHPEGPKGQLAVSHLCPGHPAKVPAVSEEGGGHEAHAERNQVGARQLRLVDPRGEAQIHQFLVPSYLWHVFYAQVTLAPLVRYSSTVRLLHSYLYYYLRFNSNSANGNMFPAFVLH